MDQGSPLSSRAGEGCTPPPSDHCSVGPKEAERRPAPGDARLPVPPSGAHLAPTQTLALSSGARPPHPDPAFPILSHSSPSCSLGSPRARDAFTAALSRASCRSLPGGASWARWPLRVCRVPASCSAPPAAALCWLVVLMQLLPPELVTWTRSRCRRCWSASRRKSSP